MPKKPETPKTPKAPKTPKEPKVKKSTAELISFSVTAVIPTQQYGNIQPRIEIKAATIEEARALVMPVIENLYETYAEVPLSGKKVKFLSHITESEKIVTAKPVETVPKVEEPTTVSSPEVSAPSSSEPTVSSVPTAPERSEPYKKAEKAISLAPSHDAIDLIKAQIEKSVKIAPEDKPELLQKALDRRNALPF